MEDFFNHFKGIDLKGIVAEYVLHNIWNKSFKELLKRTKIHNKAIIEEHNIATKVYKKELSQFKKDLHAYEKKLKRYDRQVRKGETLIETDLREPLKPEEPILNIIEIGGDENRIIDQVIFNIDNAFDWSSTISFEDLNKPKSLFDTFVYLDLMLTPKSNLLENETSKKIPFQELINNIEHNIIILGEPGAGKTTLMKYINQKCISEDYQTKKYFFPIVIKFRDFSYNESTKYSSKLMIYKILVEYFGININFQGLSTFTHNFDFNYQFLRRVIIQFVDSLNTLIIFDGFDEISNSTAKKYFLKELNFMSASLSKTNFILTSRTGDFIGNLQNSVKYEISPLSVEQIEEFILKWLGDEEKARKMQDQIRNYPYYDTVLRPLTLAHLCALFMRYQEIPKKPKTIYRKVVKLLLEDWDKQRMIDRSSIYADFTIDRKMEFISNLSFILTSEFKRTTFDSSVLSICYDRLYSSFDLPNNNSSMLQVISEIESHTGLIVRSGFEKYQFAHRSLQEFLTANYIVRLPKIPSDLNMLISMPDELAIAVALSTAPNSYITLLIVTNLRNEIKRKNFIIPFLSRIIVEKPDFKPESILAVTIAFIFNTTLVRGQISNNDILNLCESLLESKSVKQSFLVMNNMYSTHNNDIKKFETGYGLLKVWRRDSDQIS
ncbi:MAG: NACHT domain-containing protein, partial [Bacteroidota bacterium]